MQSYGGISRYHAKLAEHLSLLGEEVGVFAPLHRNRYLSQINQALVHGYGLKRYRVPGSQTMHRINEVLARRQIRRWQPDLVHETYYHQNSLSPAGCKRVITVHDMIHELFPDQVRSTDNTSQLKRLAVDRADHIICVSENTRADLTRLFGTPESKTTVVHLGMLPLPADSQSPTDSQPIIPSAAQDGKNDNPFILFVGRRGGYKNFSDLLRAVAASPRLKADFNVIAFGGSSFKSREIAEIAQCGLSSQQVRQVAGSDTVLASLYRRAALLAYPSLYEGFGLPPLEAMALGCPVVSSHVSSMPEVLGNAAEFFESGSIDALQSAIERVVYSGSRRQELFGLGKDRARQYTWEACARRTRDVYHRLFD